MCSVMVDDIRLGPCPPARRARTVKDDNVVYLARQLTDVIRGRGGKVSRRFARRVYGKGTGRLARRLFG
jgi:hypothetical protein